MDDHLFLLMGVVGVGVQGGYTRDGKRGGAIIWRGWSCPQGLSCDQFKMADNMKCMWQVRDGRSVSSRRVDATPSDAPAPPLVAGAPRWMPHLPLPVFC